MKKEKYDIDTLCKTFKKHAKEVGNFPKELRCAFNLSVALLTICEEIKELKKLPKRNDCQIEEMHRENADRMIKVMKKNFKIAKD